MRKIKNPVLSLSRLATVCCRCQSSLRLGSHFSFWSHQPQSISKHWTRATSKPQIYFRLVLSKRISLNRSFLPKIMDATDNSYESMVKFKGNNSKKVVSAPIMTKFKTCTLSLFLGVSILSGLLMKDRSFFSPRASTHFKFSKLNLHFQKTHRSKTSIKQDFF